MIKDIPVKDITIIENSRLRTDNSDVSLLMKDIKAHGLFHPIGVYETKDNSYVLLYGSRRLMAYKKLGYTTIPASILSKPSDDEMIVINSSENIHRENLKPHELGRVCLILKKQGLNNQEIGTRLGLSRTKIEDCLKIIQLVPEKFFSSIENISNRRNTEGKLGTNVVSAILNLRTSKANTLKCLEYAKSNVISKADISKLGEMLSQGRTYESAMQNLKNLRSFSFAIGFKKKEVEQFLKREKLTLTRYVMEVLRGQRKPNTSVLM